jgi:hypothetical protein
VAHPVWGGNGAAIPSGAGSKYIETFSVFLDLMIR